MSSWLDLFTGQWTDIWGVQAPDPAQYGDYYSIQVEVYRDSAPTVLVDVLNGRMRPNTLSELRGHGAGSFLISKFDDKILKDPTLLDYRNYIKIRLNGLVVGGFIIQTKKTVIVGSGEEADETWEIAGEGPRSWVRDASVYPPKGLQLGSAENRYFNFSTEQGSWYNAADWPYATMRWQYNNVSNGAPKGHAPANWPDAPLARWVWNSPYTGSDPLGYVYFRHEFTVTGTPGTTKRYAFFIAIDDVGEVYVDGELKATIEDSSWTDTTRVELDLYPGPHVIGVKARNDNMGSPGEMLAALFTYGNPSVPSSAVLVNHTGMANTWRINAYPTTEPGWTLGDIILTLLNEAKARGVRFANNFTPMFGSTTDSNGTPWTDKIPMSFGVGSTYEEVINAVEELGCDVWVDPDTLKFYAWKRRGADRSVSGIMNGNLVESRRNMITVPLAQSTAVPNGWNVANGSASGGWVLSTTPTGVPYIFTGRINEALAIGDQVFGQIQVQSDSANISYVRVNVHQRGSNNYRGEAGAQVIVPVTVGVPVTVDLSWTATVAVATNDLDISVVPCNATGTFISPPTGSVFKARYPILSRQQTNYFDGNTTASLTNQEKFRWLGVENNSASVREVPENYGNIVEFTKGKNLVGADETGQAQIANTLMLRSADGWSESAAQDATSIAKYGRVETQMSTQLSTSGSQALVQEVFRQKALPELSATFDIVPIKGAIPFLDFNVGDYVTAPGSIPGSRDTRRVMSIAFAEDEKTGLPRYSVEFDTIFKDRQTELEKWISRVSNSSSIGGSFANSGQLPSTVITVPPAKPLGAVPDPPTGLNVTSVGKYAPDGTSTSDFSLTWNPVVTGSGFGALEITQYEVWGKLSTDTDYNALVTVFDTFAALRGFRPGDTWSFKVRAISRSGGPGNFSDPFSLAAAAPVQLLGKPSTPTLTTAYGQVEVKWNGLLGGNPAPTYLRYVRVERKLTSGSTWAPVAALTNYALQDITPTTGQSYDYRLVAVDIYGRDSSSPSDPASITPTGVDLGDLDQQVKDAIQAAQNAADTAQTTATNANIAAGLAQAQANTATTNAATAQAKADQAFSDAAAAQSAANAAQTTANGKNKIVRSTSVASGTTGYVAGDQWWQYSGADVIGFWIYSGSAWVSQTLASGAISGGAIDSTKLSTAVNTSISNAQSTANTALTSAATAQTTADGKNKIVRSTAVASGTAYVNGDIWYQYSGANLIGMWLFQSGAWVSQVLDNTVIATLDAGKITTGTLDAARIAAKSISVDKLLVGNTDNLVPDAGFINPTASGWVNAAISIVAGGGRGANTNALRITGTGAQKGFYNPTNVPVREGETYRLSVWVRSSIALAANGLLGPYFQVDRTGSTMVTGGQSASPVLVANTWTLVEGTYTVPALGYQLRVGFFAQAALTSGATLDFTEPSVTRMSDGQLIVDGSITTSKMVAGSITAASGIIADAAITNAKIADATITSAKILSVDAGSITTGFLNAARIQAGSLTGTMISAKTITVDKLLIGDFTNAFPDPQFLDARGYAIWTPANGGLEKNGTGTQTGSYWSHTQFSVKPGDQYSVKYTRTDVTNSGGAVGLYLQSSTDGTNWSAAFYWLQTSTPGEVSGSFTVPAGALYIRCGYYTEVSMTSTVRVRVSAPTIRLRAAGELIVDGAITAAKILAGTITGDKISAGTISTSKMLITNQDNIVEDPSFEYSTTSGVAWNLSNGATIAATSPRSGSNALQVPTSTTAREMAVSTAAFAVEADQQFRLGAWFQLASGSIANTGVAVRIAYGATESTTTTYSADIISIPINAAPTYQQATAVWTVPAGARWARISVVCRDLTAGKTYQVDDISCYLMSDGQLIVDGAITTAKLGAQQVTADKMAAGSIAAGSIQSGAVTTDKLAAGSVTANELAVGAVTANHIVAGAIQVSHLSPSVGSSIDISANSSVNILINRADATDANLAATNGTVNQLTTYYSFGPDGAIIGKSDSAFKLALKNDRIEISENGVVVSYWDSGRMVVPSFVGEQVVLGNHKLEKYSTGTVVRAI